MQWPRSPRSQPRKPRFNIAVSSRSVLARRCSRDTATLVAWMTCASMPRSRSQRASQKLSRPSLVRHGNPGDRPSGLNCFVPPAMQQFQQVFRVRLQFLQRFPARHPVSARRPASLIDRVSMTAISVLSCMRGGGTGFTVVVGFLHSELRQLQVASKRRFYSCLAACPIASFSALLTLWLSMTAAVGLASRPIASRHFT